MRTLIKQWNAASQQQHRMMYNGSVGGGGADSLGGGSGGSHDHPDPHSDGPPDLLDPEVTVKLEPGLGGLGQQGSSMNYGEMLGDQQQPPPIPDPVFDSSFSSPLDHDLSIGGIAFGDLPGKSGLTLGSVLNSPHKTKKKKRKASDVGWTSPKRNAADDGESSGDDDSTPLGTPTSREASELRAGTPTSATSGLEFTALTDLENSVPGLTGGDKPSDNELEEVMMAATGEIDESDDVFKSNKKKKSRVEKERTANDILMDLENKNLVPPSVSITPISCGGNPPNFGAVLSGMGLDRRPGIEIIPITTSPPAPVPTSITITPIPKSSDERSKDRKKSRDGEKSGSKTSSSEKKRKRKREESPMGPPEKLPPKNDPLSKRVSVSIEPAESSPSSPVSAIRKFTSSPTGGSSTSSPLAIISKGSPGSSKSSKSSHQSPKHSPAYSSPKNNLISSPKTSSTSSGGSPKQGSSSSVGKPSLTALKSAVSSPSKDKSKSSSSSSSSKSSSGSDKSERRSPKMKTSSSKSSSRSSTSSPGGGQSTGGGGGEGGGADSAQTGGTGTPAPSGGSDPGKASSSNSASSSSRNRKGSLSAIVDKLKSAQVGDELIVSPHSREKDASKKDRDKKPVVVATPVDLKTSTPPTPGAPKVDGKSGEYSVKHSSDVMKITINKTKTRDKTREKVHTGLKPGVSSSPSSKKPSSSSSSSSSTKSGTSSSTSSSSYKKKSESTGSSSSKPSKDKLIKSSSSSSIKDKIIPTSGSSSKKEVTVLSTNTVIDSGIVKALDTKFQIPKLSARASVTAAEKKSLGVRGGEENPPPSPSPSVSVHIVPSLRISPRNSPGVITEDDLMDEALVGGK